MKVAFVSHFGGLGGAERSLLELMPALRATGVHPTLIAPEPSPLSEAARALHLPTHRAPFRRLERRRSVDFVRSAARLPLGWLHLRRLLCGLRPDIVHANTGAAMAWVGPVARRLGIPTVWHWRDFDRGAHVPLLGSSCDLALTISESVTRHATAELRGHTPVVCVGNGVRDLPTAAPLEVASWRRPGTVLVAMAGQAVPRKGHDVFVAAVAEARREVPELSAIAVCADWGDGSAWTRQIHAQARSGGTRVVGEIASVASLFEAADIVVVPSRREPFGRVAVEGMLAARPVIASDVDGLSEIVDPGRTGLLVQPDDPEALAAAVVTLARDPELRKEMGRAGRARARERFTPERVADALRAAYATLPLSVTG